MRPQTRRSIDGLLAIGPHLLDAQHRALTAYAARTDHVLDVFWVILPGEDPAADVPETGVPIIVFDDEIARFTADEIDSAAGNDHTPRCAVTDWHVAHATPQPKSATTHLPVYGAAAEGELAADAVLCVGAEALDRQIARIEAYALRSAIRLRGVYVAGDVHNLRVLLRDFSASNRALGAGPALTVGLHGKVEVHE